MARGTANCTCEECGKAFVIYNYKCSNRKSADQWEEYAQEHYTECPECEKARHEKEIAVKNEAARKQSEGLPQLKGSEKQLAWAITIRQNFIERMKKECEKAETAIPYIVGKYTEAKDWIENRGADNDGYRKLWARNPENKEKVM